jgi:hypothetical protein
LGAAAFFAGAAAFFAGAAAFFAGAAAFFAGAAAFFAGAAAFFAGAAAFFAGAAAFFAGAAAFLAGAAAFFAGAAAFFAGAAAFTAAFFAGAAAAFGSLAFFVAIVILLFNWFGNYHKIVWCSCPCTQSFKLHNMWVYKAVCIPCQLICWGISVISRLFPSTTFTRVETAFIEGYEGAFGEAFEERKPGRFHVGFDASEFVFSGAARQRTIIP